MDKNDIMQIFLTNNDCYVKGAKIAPEGIVVHSTGANNKKVSRYVQPDNGVIGVNKNKNDWNRPGVKACVHAFIGVDAVGKVCVVQTLPWNYRCWGCASGKKGSYNNSHIQFEICEDSLSNRVYFDQVFDKAADLCAYLMTLYPSISLENVVSHCESHKLGYGSNHGDPDHWLKRFGYDMDWFREKVRSRIEKLQNPSNLDSLQKGDIIRLKDNATYTNGKKIPAWVLKSKLYYRGMKNENVVFSVLKVGAITGTISPDMIVFENSSTSTETTAPVEKPKTTVTYISHTHNGKWLGEIVGYNEENSKGYSGVMGKSIDAYAVKLSEGTITYRAHTKGGKWYGKINGYSTSDSDNYSGVINKPIDLITMKAEGINGTLKYRVHDKTKNKWYGWITGYSTVISSNYAGVKGQEIDAIQITIE